MPDGKEVFGVWLGDAQFLEHDTLNSWDLVLDAIDDGDCIDLWDLWHYSPWEAVEKVARKPGSGTLLAALERKGPFWFLQAPDSYSMYPKAFELERLGNVVFEGKSVGEKTAWLGRFSKRDVGTELFSRFPANVPEGEEDEWINREGKKDGCAEDGGVHQTHYPKTC
jgi:hypothetical protein